MFLGWVLIAGKHKEVDLDTETTAIGLSAAVIIPMVLQLLKSSFPTVPLRIYPLLGFVLGTGWYIATAVSSGEPLTTTIVLTAVAVGLSIPGTYEIAKAVRGDSGDSGDPISGVSTSIRDQPPT